MTIARTCKYCGVLFVAFGNPCDDAEFRQHCKNYKNFQQREIESPQSWIDPPKHYGGDTTYEVIKVLDAWQLNFCLGNAVKYIARAGKKGGLIEDLRKARWYLDWEIQKLEKANAKLPNSKGT